ncbi:hypothetical protein LTR95_004942 [Oleoguttula sp. CCFEE 5521]
MAETPPSKRPRIDFADTFIVKVGEPPNSKSYTLPTKILAARSNFFKAALSSTWRNEDLPIELKDVKIEDFETYMHCVTCDVVDLVMDPKFSQRHWRTLTDLHILADRMLDSQTNNLVMDTLLHSVGASPSLPNDETMCKIYEATVVGSPLRKIAVDWALHELDQQSNQPPTDDLPREMLQDIFCEYRRLKSVDGNGTRIVNTVFWVDAVDRPKCYYHQHDKGHPKCKSVGVLMPLSALS